MNPLRKAAPVHQIEDLCDDLIDQLEEGEQDEAIATAETMLRTVREFFSANGWMISSIAAILMADVAAFSTGG